MSFYYSPYATLLFLAAVISVAFAWYGLRRRQQSEALVFGLLMFALFWWSLCYGLHICGANLETQYFFNRIKYIGVVVVPPLWLILALQYEHQHSVLTRRNVTLMFLPAALFLTIVLTDPWLHLWWPEVWLEKVNGHLVLKHSHGMSYYAHVVISYLFITLGLWFYVRFYRRTALIYRSQSVLVVVAAAFPLVASALTQLGLSPLPWGLDSFFFTISGVLIAIAIFRYRFLDIMPVARRVIVEQVPESVIVIDEHGRIVDANPAAQAMIGKPGKPIVGQTLVTVVHIPELQKALQELGQSHRDRPCEQDVYLGAQNDRRVLSLKITPLMERGTRSIGQIILLQDISERVAAQQKVETLYQQAEVQRKRLALTMNATSDAIVLLDANGEILADNPAARQILKTEQGSRFPSALQAVLDQAQAVSRVIKTDIDIDEQSFHVVAAPIVGTGLVLTMHDVTHFKQLARLKDEFVSTVSHDLRAPLTSIIGYAQMAQHPAASEEKREKAMSRIETSAWRMSNLVTDMLDLATIEAGVEPRLEPIELDQLARAVMEDLEGAVFAKKLALQYELEGPATVQADPRLLIQVWRNLIDNAIKYTSEGTITVRVRATDNRVTGQVSDTGIGISPADIPYVFDKFFRAKRPYTQGMNGTGLGLTLVKSIIERHGGKIWVDSEVGVGSTFTFTLPPKSNGKQVKQS